MSDETQGALPPDAAPDAPSAAPSTELQPAGSQHFCYGCGRPIHPQALACPQCGAPQQQSRALAPVPSRSAVPAVPGRGRDAFCRACGVPLNAAAPLCPACGAPQAVMPNRLHVPGGRSRVAAALLAIFVGGFGVHKFYLGQPGLGVLYLLFFWTFIPALVAFIEAIVYLSMTDQAFDLRYN